MAENTGFVLKLSDQATREMYYQQLLTWSGWENADPKHPLTLRDVVTVSRRYLFMRATNMGTDALRGTMVSGMLAENGAFVGHLRESIHGGLHVLNTLAEAAQLAEEETPFVRTFTPGESAPAYIDALRFVQKEFNLSINHALLAGSLGSLPAHDMLATLGLVAPDAKLTVVDLLGGSLPETARRGGAYTFEKADLLCRIPLGQDVIFTNVLLRNLGREDYSGDSLDKIRTFFELAKNALNTNGALIMSEPLPSHILAYVKGCLVEMGFRVFTAPGKTFKNRLVTDQFFASTQTSYRGEDVEKSRELTTIIAVKQG